MAIDDPQSVFEEQIRSEERAESPVARYLTAALELVPGLSDVAKVAGLWINRERDERRKAFIEILASELHFVKGRLEELGKEHARCVGKTFPELVLDAIEKAEQTRSRGRIDRIARIVAHAAVELTAPDLTEELGRIAMGLDDSDVLVLSELVRGQRPALARASGQVGSEAANNYWQTGQIGNDVQSAVAKFGNTAASPRSAIADRLNITEGELQSRCAKLQSYGLIVQVERNQFKNWPGNTPYAVLARGIEFADSVMSFIKSGSGP